MNALGILLPSGLLETWWYAALSGFVALNTLAYAVVSIVMTLPRHRRAAGALPDLPEAPADQP